MLLPATKESVSEIPVASIRELFALIVSNESWLEIYDRPPESFL
jgi:hypothetical protein